MATLQRMPTYFISHGGGPWPWLERNQEAYRNLRISLEALPQELPEKPRAILMISGHWEEDQFAVMSSPRPPMIYDYSGFPEHTYRIQYPAPGSPELAERVQEILQSAGFAASLDPNQGFDHGTFSPLAVSYPQADVPVVQLSIRSDYDPEAHLQAGQALAPLRDQGILILASGLSYHNLRMFNPQARVPSHQFDGWLQEALIKNTSEARFEKLRHWDRAPAARLAHPREDHLIPLMVAVGAAKEDPAKLSYHEDDFMGGIAVSSFRFG